MKMEELVARLVETDAGGINQCLPPFRGKVARPKAVTNEGEAVREAAAPSSAPFGGTFPHRGKAYQCGPLR